MRKYDALKEIALANFELLLELWNLEYVKVSEHEYDFKSPTRVDSNFGACRFNLEKACGSDFAQRECFTKEDFTGFGVGFASRDFASLGEKGYTKSGFDIIGLCQRVHNLRTYRQGADALKSDLSEIYQKSGKLVAAAKDAAEQRRKRQELKNEQVIQFAKRLWRSCEDVLYEGSVAYRYLSKRRGIQVYDPKTTRAHPGLFHLQRKEHYPAVMFKVTKEPGGPLQAVHRIYLEPPDRKADLPDPKMALGSIKGLGIWFGEPCDTLVIKEGPEEALSWLDAGYPFVVSTINATNFHNMVIPDYVKTLILSPDRDKAGMLSFKKALVSYKRDGLVIQVGTGIK